MALDNRFFSSGSSRIPDDLVEDTVNVNDTHTHSFIGELPQTGTGNWLPTGSTFDMEQIVIPIITRGELSKRLIGLEKKYGLKSADFYSQWQSGNAPSGMDAIVWATLWEAWISNYLMQQ
jgi:hypothetical protein